jgi:hypothetical protein
MNISRAYIKTELKISSNSESDNNASKISENILSESSKNKSI